MAIGDAPMRGHLTDTRPSQALMAARWPPFPTFRQRPSAGAGGARPADHGPSTDDSSRRPPSPEAVGGTAAAGAFHPFDQQWRDYRAINEVLQRGGGLPALFESTGAVTDPTRMTALLDGLGQLASETARRTLGDRFAVERYVRGAERLLTSSFVDGLGATLEQAQGPILLLMDTYENLENVDGWICSALVPVLPSGVRLIMLGRNQLHRVNFDWSEYGEAVGALPLPELKEDEAKAYLRHYGLTDPAALSRYQ